MSFYKELVTIAGAECVQTEELMRGHTTFRIGGPADYFVTPADGDVLSAAIQCCRQHDMPYFIMGNGSNLLVSDEGYRGVVFSICKTMDEVRTTVSGDTVTVTAGAGVMLSKLARMVSDMGYAGFEYATGIPGTLGGAVTMNAGAYGGEIAMNICWAEVMDLEGHVMRLDKNALELSYRHSIIMAREYIVLCAALEFARGSSTEICEKVQCLGESRRSKQPLEYPSAGSTFKRPEGYFAGKLIQDCGLKGYRIGDAMVSEKHSGFVINAGEASAAEVMALIKHIQTCVKAAYGVNIEPEIRMLGVF